MGIQHLIKGITAGVMGGYGAGVVTNVLFQVAAGGITPGTSISAAISGPLVLIMTTIGFGLGLAYGWDEHEKAESAAKAT
jgi:hypothetical protein